MSTATPTAPPPAGSPLMTGEEFVLIDGHEQMALIDGVLVQEPDMPSVTHGEICLNVGGELRQFVKANKLGRVCGNDTSLRLRRNPDTVRGPDVCYFSTARMPPGQRLEGVTDVIPELVVEVRSPSNTWADLLAKVALYLEAGVTAVMVVVPEDETATVYRMNEFHQTFHNGDDVTLPDVLPGFAVPLKRFFE